MLLIGLPYIIGNSKFQGKRAESLFISTFGNKIMKNV